MLNLTQHEQEALSASVINLADGHGRQDLTLSQATIIKRLHELFGDSTRRPLQEIEWRAQSAFFNCLRQASAPVDPGRIFSIYSSSVATMAVTRYLYRNDHRVALVHPTFDNIPDLLRDYVRLFPLSEQSIDNADWRQVEQERGTCVFVTTPNNPTGWYLEKSRFESMVAWAARRNILLCFDTSFRGFDERTQFDMYAALEGAQVNYIVLEDTGKLWPMAELKLGFIGVSASLVQPLQRIVSDILLSVSPFVLRLIEELAKDHANGGAVDLYRLIATNRHLVRMALKDLAGTSLINPDALVSVCCIRFSTAEERQRVQADLKKRRVHVLPVSQFYWANPAAGAPELRIALARNTSLIDVGLEHLREICLHR